MQNKEKIAISIDKDLLRKIDDVVDGVEVKSRSHAFELLLRKALESDVEEAIIFAGGKRKKEKPKPLLEIRGKPVLEYNLEWLKNNGVKKVYLAVSEKEEFEKKFGRGYHMGLQIDYLEEKEPLGTAGSLFMARNLFKKTFVAMNGDVMCSFDLKNMVQFHKKSRAIVTVALREVKTVERYGSAMLEGDKVVEFVEKPKKEEVKGSLINAGVYILEPEIFGHLPKQGALEKEVFPKLVEKKLLSGYVFSGLFIDAEELEGKK